MKNKISLNDFSFRFSGNGHYDVTYTSPVTGSMWTATIDDMPLIDATKSNWDNVKIQDLNLLKKLCKQLCEWN
jgi:hypothetical protein